MRASTCDDEAMRSMIGFLSLGRLTEAERRAVTGHLESCLSCRTERDEVDRVVSLLGLLSTADVSDLVGDLDPAEATAPSPAVAADRQIRCGEGNRRPRPAAGPLVRGPHTRRSATSRRWRTVAFGLTGLVALALSTLLLLNPWPSPDRLGPVVAVAAAQDVTSGVDMSATLYAGDHQVGVRLRTDGLGLGSYQLYAVTEDGAELLLGRLTGKPGEGTYAGEIPLPIDELQSFSLRQVDGPLTVSAAITKGAVPKKPGKW